jgi:hypothetical protein
MAPLCRLSSCLPEAPETRPITVAPFPVHRRCSPYGNDLVCAAVWVQMPARRRFSSSGSLSARGDDLMVTYLPEPRSGSGIT